MAGCSLEGGGRGLLGGQCVRVCGENMFAIKVCSKHIGDNVLFAHFSVFTFLIICKKGTFPIG